MPTEETPIVSLAQFADAFDISHDDADPVASLPVTLEQARRYVNSLNTSEQILPDGYTQLEYLESTGTQYIDLGFGFQGSDDAEIDFQMTQAPTSAEGIFGGRDTSSARGYMLYAEAITDGFVFLYNNTYITNLNNDWYDRHVFKKTGTNIYFDGVANSQTVSASFTQTKHAFLFAWHTEGNQPNRSKTKIFSFTMTRSGSKYCELIPAKRDSDGVLGMYDIVRNTFLTNSGTGSFVAGPSVAQTFDNFPQDFTKLEYIESNGSQALDTGYNPTSNTRVVLDYNLTQLTGKWMGIFAVRDLNGYANQYAYWSNETGVYRSNYSGETGILFGSQNTNRHIIDKDKAVLKEDGIVVANHPAATFSCNYSLHIFCGNTGGTKEHYAYMKLYSCKIYNDDVLVRDYVPVKRTRDSAIGLYDRVQKTFSSSATSTSFIAGTAVEQDYSDLENKVMTIKQLSTLSKKTLGKRLLEYVQFTGTQFIDTGYNPNGETRVVIDLYLDADQYGNNEVVAIFGGRTSTTAGSFTLWRMSSSRFRYDYGTRQTTIDNSTAGNFTIDFNKNVIKINTLTRSVTKATFQSTHSLRLGSNYTNTGSSYNDSNFNDLRRFSGKVYSMKIYDNGTLVRDLKPVKDLKTGQIGFYDILSGVFYENNGTGTFGAGPEVGYV